MKKLKAALILLGLFLLTGAIISFGFTVLVGLFVVSAAVISSIACITVIVTIFEITIDYLKTFLKR